MNELIWPIALRPGEGQELASLGSHSASLGGAGNGHPAAAAEVEQSLITEDSQRPQHRIGIDAENGCQISSGREALARLCLAVGDRPADLGGDLIVQICRLVAVDLAPAHSAMHTSTIMEAGLGSNSAGQHRSGEIFHALIAAARARQNRRRLLLIVIAALLVAALAVELSRGRPTQPSSPNSIASQRLFAAQAPFIGVACHVPNRPGCGRIGIAVWLRTRAQSVVATLDGRKVALRDESSGGRVVTYIGYVHLSATSLRLPKLWIGNPPRFLVLHVIARRGSAVATKTLRLILHPGWG